MPLPTLTRGKPAHDPAGPDEETVVVARSRFAPPRRRRRTRWVLAVLAVVGVVAAAYVVWFSSLLAVQQVQVDGTSYLAPVQVRAVAKVPTGRPLARVDLAAIRERVTVMPAVASVRVSRAWPHGVRIEVTERTAVAVVPQGSRFRGLSADGVLFREYDGRPAGLPEVQDEGADRDARTEAARVVGALPPDLLGRVDHISVKTIDQIRLTLRNGRQVIWGSSAGSAEKAQVLAALVKHPSSVIDVSVPGRPTTRP